MLILVAEGITQGYLEYIPVAQKFLTGGFNFRKDCFYCGYVITGREKKTKKPCYVSCKNREVDKAVHQAIFDRKYD